LFLRAIDKDHLVWLEKLDAFINPLNELFVICWRLTNEALNSGGHLLSLLRELGRIFSELISCTSLTGEVKKLDYFRHTLVISTEPTTRFTARTGRKPQIDTRFYTP